MIPSCDNSTFCFNGGECKFDGAVNHNTCLCKTYWDSSTGCNTTIFPTYNGYDRIYPGFGIPLYAILSLLYLFEITMDVIRKKYTPILFTKAVILVFTCSRVTTISIWLVSSLGDTTKYARISAFIDSAGTLLLISANVLVVISWLSLILRAKDLGEKDKKMIMIKKGLFITVGIVGPLNIITLIVNEINSALGFLLAITVVLLLLAVVANAIISVVYLVRIYRWIKEIHKTKMIKLIEKKSKWVITLLSMSISVVFFLLVFFVIRRNSPSMYLAIDIISRTIELILSSVMFMFLETNLVNSIKEKAVVWSSKLTPSTSGTKTGKSGKGSKGGSKGSDTTTTTAYGEDTVSI